ncbi:ATP-dependent nuclease [Peribacillus frigoritolerans]|uniref:ATP-dependent nuclease n=1 Tax=Peribacillus frigoritolerans TaxID=450367 RepID=UPI00222EA3AB|nr:AAA family ATPase [Peribacillus frigoritolerans]UZD44889.1 AAA family ATPase [Peribacillus frigoritolerans]
MEFKKLVIKNFRNFECVNVNLTNQNVIFGMNDVGKTNFLYALRFLLDRDTRKNGFKESDFFQRNIGNEIEIILEISLEDYEQSDDTKFIVSKVGGARTTDNLDTFYFMVKSKFDTAEEIGEPQLYWGNDLTNLSLLPANGAFTDLDKLFKVVYLDPAINLEHVFKKNRRSIFDQSKLSDEDIEISNEIKQISNNLNEKIGEMTVIKEFQNILTDEYHSLKKEDIKIELKSEMAIKGYFNDLTPYIKKDNDDNLYPTSGDGRRKIIAYSMMNHLIKNQEANKIVVYLIEEPENSLHRSMQIALSYQLFNMDIYKYFFLSTHSSELLYEMDRAALIRIYSRDKTDCASIIYKVDQTYKNLKKELNRSLANALFADKVLLVEGPSEKVLFERILYLINPLYELQGGYLMEVNGIKFKPYVEVLSALEIKWFVKTDNDLKSKRNNQNNFDLIGLNRCIEIINREKMNYIDIDFEPAKYANGKYNTSLKEEIIKNEKLKIYEGNSSLIEEFNTNNIYLSKIDLENDLYEAIKEKMEEVFGNNPIKKLQSAKLINMIKLAEHLEEADCRVIYEHELFKVLREFSNYGFSNS